MRPIFAAYDQACVGRPLVAEGAEVAVDVSNCHQPPGSRELGRRRRFADPGDTLEAQDRPGAVVRAAAPAVAAATLPSSFGGSSGGGGGMGFIPPAPGAGFGDGLNIGTGHP